MNTMATILKKLAGLTLGIALFAPSAHAQTAAYVERTNVNLRNRTLFVDVSIGEQNACATYNFKFKLKTSKAGQVPVDYGYQRIAGVIGGPVQNEAMLGTGNARLCTKTANDSLLCGNVTLSAGTGPIAKLKNGDTTLYDVKLTYYSLVFNIPDGVNLNPNDSVEICMDAIIFATTCERCGVNNTDMVFIPASDIKPGCPEADKVQGLIACYQRDSRAQNWEGWIQDPRDCKPYRIVRMPDERWWFAQNLAYTGGDVKEETWANQASNNPNLDGNILKTAWTAGGNNEPIGGINNGYAPPANAVMGIQNAQNPIPSVATYGYLYPWATVMSVDGKADTEAAVVNPMGHGLTSTRRVICPAGWVLPSRYDWGKMLNLVERECGGNCDASGANSIGGNHKESPCFHNYPGGTSQWAASRCAFKDLLSTDVAPYRAESLLGGNINSYYNGDTAVMPRTKLASPENIITYATSWEPAWSYFLPETAGTDRYGFSIKPAGMRNPVAASDGVNSGFYYRGEFAGFWTSTQEVDNNNPAYTGQEEAFMVGFRYNYRMNADFNSAVQSWAMDKRTGLSVRCVARTQN